MKAKERPGAHGKSIVQMTELHLQQIEGAEPEMMVGNGSDNKEKIKIPKDEAHLVHVLLEATQFDQSTGVKLSVPSRQVFNVNAFERAKENNGFAGLTVQTIHSPKEAKKLGDAVEGTRVVDTNYATMQDRYEALTGEKPDTSYTEFQLDQAIRAAEHALRLLESKAQKAIDTTNAPAHVPPVAVHIEQVSINTEGEPKEEAAKIALAAAQETPPTGDGRTSVDQPTETLREAQAATTEDAAVAAALVAPLPHSPVTTEPGNSPPPSRRGAAPKANK